MREARSRGRTSRRQWEHAVGWLLASWTAVCLAVQPGRAASVDFETAPPGSDAATLATPGVSIGGGLVLDELLVETLLGYPAIGTWNTTPGGSKGAINTLAASITLDFDVPVSFLGIDVLTLPDDAGDPGALLLVGYDGATPVVSGNFTPVPESVGDSGQPEARIQIAAASISRAVLCVPDPDAPFHCLEPGRVTAFWIDGLDFTPVPEPGTAALLGLSLAIFAGARRTR